MAKLIDQRLPQPSSEKLPPVEDGNKYRDPHPDIMLKVSDFGILITERDVFIKSFPPELREFCRSGGRKSVKAIGDRGY